MNLARFTVDSAQWGQLLLLRPVPHHKDACGDLGCLKGSYLEPHIPVVSGESLSHALHGHATPLMQELGPNPQALLRMIPVAHRQCAEFKACILARFGDCHPCPTVPDCYEAPGVVGEAQMAANAVILSWAEGRYVLVAEGGEFSL